MKVLGRHVIVELADCNREVLNDLDQIQKHLNEAVRKSGATIVRSVFHRYNPQGVSGVVVIAESHISVHTWPEYGYAAVDYFTCGQSVNPYPAHEYLKEKFGAREVHLQELQRGIPSADDEVLQHKPTSVG